MSSLRVVFFGTPQFAVPTLEALLHSSHTVAAVVTQPDRPRGRGQKTSDAPVKERALAAGVPVLQPTALKAPSFLADLDAVAADLGVVAAYGRILTEAVLAAPRLGMINVHASLLPKYRGAAPVHRAVIAGETDTGVTIMRVVKALDAGPMLATVHRAIGADVTSADVERELSVAGAHLLVETVDRLARGPVEEVAQDEAHATYAPRLTKDDGRIDWQRAARDVHNLVRGLHPWPLASSYLQGVRLIVRRTRIVPLDRSSSPGTVVAARGDSFIVAAGEGALELLEVQAEGSRAMSAREYLAGRRISPGAVFTAVP